MEKLIASEKAIEVIELLKKKYGEILIQQSSGCCDGTVPMCFEAKGYYLSSQMIKVGELAGVPYYIDKTQDEYLRNMQIIVDVMEDRGASFSLESTEGYGFIMHSAILDSSKD